MKYFLKIFSIELRNLIYFITKNHISPQDTDSATHTNSKLSLRDFWFYTFNYCASGVWSLGNTNADFFIDVYSLWNRFLYFVAQKNILMKSLYSMHFNRYSVVSIHYLHNSAVISRLYQFKYWFGNILSVTR